MPLLHYYRHLHRRSHVLAIRFLTFPVIVFLFLRCCFGETYNDAVTLSFNLVILPVKPIIHTTKEIITLSIDIGDHVHRLCDVGAIPDLFKFQIVVDKRITAGKKKAGTGD